MWRSTSVGALVAVAQFVATWSVLGAVRDDYDPVTQALSELAETGSPTRTAMTASFIAYGVLVAAFAPTLRRALPGEATAPLAAVLANGAGTVAVGLLPCSPGCPGAAASYGDLGHTLAAAVAYGGLVAAPLTTARGLRGAGRRGLRRACLALGWLTLAGVAGWVGGVVGEADGLAQRAATTTGHAWYVVVAVAVLRNRGRLGTATADVA